MDFAQELRNSRYTSSSTYLNFLLQYKQRANIYYTFFEGKDDESFYVNFLSNFLSKWAFVCFRCGNKNKVYEIYKKINWKYYSKNRVLFFVDKDLADLIPETNPIDENIYVTSLYSIENYIAEIEILRRVIRELCGFDDEGRINLLLRKFRFVQNRFYKKILPLMAWILVMRRKQISLNLNNINFSHLYEIDEDLNLKKKKEVINKVKAMTGVNDSFSRDEIAGAISELKKIEDPKIFVRGKFDLWLFTTFATKLPDVLNKSQNYGEENITLKVPLSVTNGIRVLGTRVKIPNCLGTFLENQVNKNSSAI